MATIWETLKAGRQFAEDCMTSISRTNNGNIVLGNRTQAFKQYQVCISVEGYNRPARGVDSVELSFNCYDETIAGSCELAQSIVDALPSNMIYTYDEKKYTLTFSDLYQDVPDNDFYKTSVSVRFAS